MVVVVDCMLLYFTVLYLASWHAHASYSAQASSGLSPGQLRPLPSPYSPK